MFLTLCFISAVVLFKIRPYGCWKKSKHYWVTGKDSRPVLRVPNGRSQCYDG